MGQHSSRSTRFFNCCAQAEGTSRNGHSTADDRKRTININHGAQTTKFRSNTISTSKYSLFTFFPKFLYEQFRKYSNVFFLCIVIFQVKTTHPKVFSPFAYVLHLANSRCLTDGKIYDGCSIDVHSSLCCRERDHRRCGEWLIACWEDQSSAEI